MAKSSNQKLKLLYLKEIFERYTDEEHGLSINEIIDHLEAYDIHAERKALYQDMEELRRFGMEIETDQQGRNTTYRLLTQQFEAAELKLLVDAIQAARFISESKSAKLIKKLETLLSVYDAQQLQRQVLISGRVKSMNESIYYNVDKLHTAIGQNLQIRFRYFQWNVKKEMVYRHDGNWYTVSPWSLLWDDEYYYLIAYDADAKKMKHYRVDKMRQVSLLEEPREGRSLFETIDLASYSNSLFGMFGGEETTVTLHCKKELAGVMIDRFGKDVMMIPDGDSFNLHVPVVPSPQFFGWLFGFGDAVKLTAPAEMTARMKEAIQKMVVLYEDR